MFGFIGHRLRGPAARLAPPGGAPLGRFPLLEVVGRGSTGIVYRSFDARHHRAVAVKILDRDLPAELAAALRAQLQAEAAAAGALAHPGIVAVYEYGEAEGHAYLVMEYVRGASLRRRLAHGECFGTGRAVELATQLLEALSHAHRRGIWHRDVKPANILTTDHDRMKLTDFGIACLPRERPGAEQEILGSAGYAAPEAYLTDALDARADVFAAGAVLYELLAGIPAYRGTRAEIMFQVCSGVPPPPSVAASRPLLAPVDAVVLRALARRPDERFASAEEFLQALRVAEAGVTAAGLRPAAPARAQAGTSPE